MKMSIHNIAAEGRKKHPSLNAMQSKINAFFRSTPSSSSPNDDHDLSIWENQQHHIINTYTRRRPNPNAVTSDPKPVTIVKNKKRNYAQLHLDFGQSDFLLRACPTCGVKFTPGDPEDEKSHNEFHKSYTQGIQFRVSSPPTRSSFAVFLSQLYLISYLCYSAGLDQRKYCSSTQFRFGSGRFVLADRPVFSQEES